MRLDRGEPAALSREVRRILDEGGGGARQCKIVASGDVNEYKIDALPAGGAPIDTFGVGAELITSSDAPALGGVYKLVERETPEGHRIGGAKGSAEKATYPFGRQVFRTSVEVSTARILSARPRRGWPGGRGSFRRCGAGARSGSPPLKEIRRRAQEEPARLPAGVLRLRDPERHPVRFSEALERAREEAIRRGTRGREEGKKPEALSLRKDAEE